MAGGEVPADPNDPTIRQMAAFGAEHISMASNCFYHKRLVTIDRAVTQVVSGMLYKLDLTIGTTTRPKSSPPTDLESCPLQENMVRRETLWLHLTCTLTSDLLLTMS